jgi:hypothetical protein
VVQDHLEVKDREDLVDKDKVILEDKDKVILEDKEEAIIIKVLMDKEYLVVIIIKILTQ